MIPSQMLKGTLEGCILNVISRAETYGYEISQQLQRYGFSDIAEGTIYPLLLRLERNGLIAAQYRDSAVGPRRKYFSITDRGAGELQVFYESWRELESAVNSVIAAASGSAELVAEPASASGPWPSPARDADGATPGKPLTEKTREKR